MLRLYKQLYKQLCLAVIAFVGVAVLAGCATASAQTTFKDIPTQGDAAHGKVIFESQNNGAPACSSCHSLEITNVVGPGLAGLADRAAKRVDGMSAREYVYESIVHPNAYLVPGFSNLMYTQYSEKLSAQDIADLTALLLGSTSK